MSINFRTLECKDFQKLAWLALFKSDTNELTVYHGHAVECHDDWIVEGVWDDDFEKGNFHESENFFGSGIKVENGKIFFVPSSALIDRLVYCHCEDQLIVSNSLVSLLSYTGARLDPKHDYKQEMLAILNGIKKYDPKYTVIHPKIECFYQLFCQNLIVGKDKILTQNRLKVRELNNFSEYTNLIKNSLTKISHNYNSENRNFKIAAFTTISSGYDSTAVSALVKSIGVDVCFTSRKSNSIIPAIVSPNRTIDDGEKIAKILGYDIKHLKNMKTKEDELYFLAASCAGPELAFYSMSQNIHANNRVSVVFTGYHGDVVWSTKTPIEKNAEEIFRGDTSGLNLSEVRIKSGFIIIAVPFMFASSANSIVKISHSREMIPWRLNNDYDRPIARRIVEEHSVPRELFGRRKKGVTKYYSYPKNKKLRKAFFDYLKTEKNMSPIRAYFYDKFVRAAMIFLMGVLYNMGFKKMIDKNDRFGLFLSHLMFVWAANTLAEKQSHKLNDCWHR